MNVVRDHTYPRTATVSGTTPIPADSGVFAAIPSATVSQDAANEVAARMPRAPSQSSPVAGGRKKPLQDLTRS